MRKLMWWTIGFTLAFSVFLEILPVSTAVILIVAGWSLAFFRYKEYQPVSMLTSTLLGGVFGAFYISAFTYMNIIPLESYENITITSYATVSAFPEVDNHSRYSVLADFDIGGKGVKTVFYGDEQLKDLKPGDTFTSTTTFSSTSLTTDGTPTVYYYNKGIFLRGMISGEIAVQSTSGIRLKYLPVYAESKIKESIMSSFSENYNGLALALVTGDKKILDPSFTSALNITGLSHTVAVSGMHLAFLASIVRKLLPRRKWWTFSIFSLVMVFFMLISGSTPSIVRATVMILMLELAPFVGRDRDDPTALATAIFFILLQNPFALRDVGLYLSVASVASIFLFSDYFREKLMNFFAVEKGDAFFSLKSSILTTFATTCAAMVFTTPIVGLYFERISIIAPIANIATLFVISILFVGCIAVAFLGCFLPFLAKCLGIFYLFFFEYLLNVIPALARSPFSSVSVHSEYYRLWFFFLYFMIFLAILLPGEKKMRYPLGIGVVSFILTSVLHLEHTYNDGLHLQVLDVGQGQSALFLLGNSLILSDCGGNAWENPGTTAANAIHDLGRTQLDLLVISHFDTDHVNGVTTLMDRVSVGIIAMPTYDVENILQKEIVKKAVTEGTKLLFVEEKVEWKVDEDKYVTLFPPVGSGGSNERGISLLVTSGQSDVLVLGDMNQETEQLFLDRFQIPPVEVLFIPHHGSKYSSSDLLMEKFTDKIGIICVGSNNYGHPTNEVLEKMEELNMEVFRTDTMGTLTFDLAA